MAVGEGLKINVLERQLGRRDAQIDRQMGELSVLREVEREARNEHERRCGCDGRGCALGGALALVARVQSRNRNQLLRLQGKAG